MVVRQAYRRALQVSARRVMATMLWIIISCWSSWELVRALEPEPVSQCDATGCSISNAYRVWSDRSTCRVASVVYPTREEEIVKSVAEAVISNQKIKVSTSTGHSIPNLSCPGSPSGVIISTKKYTSIVNIDTKTRTVTAQGGVQLRALLDGIATQGLALPVSPYWEGITLAGLLSTSSHGSSLFGRGGSLHEYVTSMRLVTPGDASEGYAKIRVLNQGDPDLNSAKVSLGVLGVISTVKLQLEPAFKRNVTLAVVNGDGGLEDEVIRVAENVEFGDITWYPALRQAVYRYDHRVSVNTPGEGRYNFAGFQPQAAVVVEALRATEELADATSNRQLKCDLARIQVSTLQLLGYGFHQNGLFFTGFPVVGPERHIMAAGGCQRNHLPGFYCPWDRRMQGLFFNEAGAALPLKHLRSFLTDVKALRDAAPNSLCALDLNTGILIRFAKKSTSAYLGTTQGQDSAMIDFTWSRGDDATTPRLDQDVIQELEQILFWKYGATPHWGKNRNYVFEGVGLKYENLSKFVDTKRRFDPRGLFSSDWSDALLGAGGHDVVVDAPYCAIEGLCRCWKDEHCAPEKRSYCRPGRVYLDARVCRTEP